MIEDNQTAALAHDIRNILTPALLSAEAMAGAKQSANMTHVSRIFLAIDKTVDLCQAALQENPALHKVNKDHNDVEVIVKEAVALAAAAAGPNIEFSIHAIPGLKTKTDNNALCRMVFNLVSNAISAIGTSDGKIKIIVSTEKNTLCICVKDNGPGLPKKVLDRLFPSILDAPRPEGRIGFGLPTTAMCARKFGGELILRSTSKNGTHFKISLPHNEAPAHHSVSVKPTH